MATALVVNKNHDSNQNLIDIINKQYSSWDMISADGYEDAMNKINTESIDMMALDSHLSCKDCQTLADTLHAKRPDANIYITITDSKIKTDYSRVMNRGLIVVPN